ncbi:response regulator [Magnetovibrio sp. PR-2]|uniref:response regulator n=1 Tax=Magnetovibrio sp. PR-2 TaxID=3120356 RepID=UPI002FCE35C7
MDRFEWERTGVLIIDDEPMIQKLIEQVLRQLGVVNIAKALNGVEAMTHLKKKQKIPHVILCDMQMPQMNGLEFIAALRGLDDVDLNDIPIIACTTVSKQGVVKEALRLGVNGFIVKPFSLQVIEERVGTVLDTMRIGQDEPVY